MCLIINKTVVGDFFKLMCLGIFKQLDVIFTYWSVMAFSSFITSVKYDTTWDIWYEPLTNILNSHLIYSGLSNKPSKEIVSNWTFRLDHQFVSTLVDIMLYWLFFEFIAATTSSERSTSESSLVPNLLCK